MPVAEPPVISEDGFELYAEIADLPLDGCRGDRDIGDLPPDERPVLEAGVVLSKAPSKAMAASLTKKRTRMLAPLRRTIKKGMSGRDVQMEFRALSKWEHRHGFGAYHDKPTPLYGEGKVKRTKHFQHAHGLKADGQIGQMTHRKLLPFIDRYGAMVLRKYHPPNTGLSEAREISVDAAIWALHNCGHHYSQVASLRCQAYYGRRRPTSGYWQYADCSGFDLWTKWLAGIKAGPYDGYTGTMTNYGTVVSQAACKPGDSAFYNWPISHVALIVAKRDGNIYVVSYGHEGAPFFELLNYRSDLNQIRSYVK